MPPGYIPIRDTPRQAKRNIDKWLHSAVNCVRGKHALGIASSAINADKTIDGQLIVRNIPTRYPARKMVIDIENCWRLAVKDQDVSRDYWIEGEVVVKDDTERESADRRFRGLNNYFTYWYRVSNAFSMFISLSVIINNLRNFRVPKPYALILNVHRNIADISPAKFTTSAGRRKISKRQASAN